MTIENETIISKTKHKTAFGLMHLIMVLVPFLAGIDKFFNFITDWERYISPLAKPFIPLSSKQIMHLAGFAEIAVGLTTAVKPRLGSTIFAGMLAGIILNLLTMKKTAAHSISRHMPGLLRSCFRPSSTRV